MALVDDKEDGDAEIKSLIISGADLMKIYNKAGKNDALD